MTKSTAVLLLALWAGAPGAARAAEIMVFAAASLANVLEELGAAYETQGGEPVVFNFAASSTLARQIDEGAPADVFFAADEAKMDDLEKHGALVEGTRRGLLANTLVVVVPDDSRLALSGPQDLAATAVRVLALAEPQSVPAGIYAKEYLQRAGVWRQVVEKVVPTENVRGALAAVESGNADAAIVYKTDALISRRVKVAYEVAAGEAPQIAYPLAVVKGGRNVEGGKAFAAYLESEEARAVFRRHGFLVPRSLAIP
jgi:molybdate transport system substrate-binding protein